jgi:hypothetical protein
MNEQDDAKSGMESDKDQRRLQAERLCVVLQSLFRGVTSAQPWRPKWTPRAIHVIVSCISARRSVESHVFAFSRSAIHLMPYGRLIVH